MPEAPKYYPTTTECTPTGLRYKPMWTYKLPYAPDTFACCDYLANNGGNKIAFAFTDRDYGVIELGRLHPNVDFHGDKRFYIDFKMWKDPDGGPIKAMDMSFGYDYQRLYTLYKQGLNDGTYKLWLTRYETGNYKDGSRITPPISIPLYSFIHSRRLRGHPALIGRTYPHDYTHAEELVPPEGWDDLWKYVTKAVPEPPLPPLPPPPPPPPGVPDIGALIPNNYPKSVKVEGASTSFRPTVSNRPFVLAVIPAGYSNLEFWGLGGGHNVIFDVLTTDGKHLFGGSSAVDASGVNQTFNPAMITVANGFNAGAVYDRSQLNGVGAVIPYNYDNPAQFTIDGMTIQYTGDVGTARGIPSYFSIDVATTDLVIIGIACHACGFSVRGAWVGEPTPPPPPDPEPEPDPKPREPDVMCSVLEYLEAYGVVGVCLDRPLLEPFFNCLVTNDKVFVTMPVFFKPDKVKLSWLTDMDDWKMYWTPDHPRAIYQLLIMLNETTSQIEACAVVGAFSWWLEEKNTPWPDITPQMPLKSRMVQIDDCVVWQCVHERTFPASMTNEAWYEHLIRFWTSQDGNQAVPLTDYDPNAWESSKLSERFWQPYQMEYVRIPDLIEDLLKMNTTVLRPLQYRVTQAYIWTPIVSDLYKKAMADWSGRRVYGLRGKEFIEYEVVYHNYKRKIIRGIQTTEDTQPTETPVEYVFDPGTEGVSLTLKPGVYTIEAEGAAGGAAHHTMTRKTTGAHGSTDVTTVAYKGGRGARVVGELELNKTENFFVYVGKTGNSDGTSSGMGSGTGGSYEYEDTSLDLTTKTWESKSGSGGSLTALVYKTDTPGAEVLVAGSGGGSGISRVEDERTGGDGGGLTGGPGVSASEIVAEGGDVTGGGTLRFGQDAQAQSTAGGGGAGHSGGRANQGLAPGVLYAGGGGGGSSFVNGIDGYPNNTSAIAFKSGVVTPAVVEGDGSMKITGVEYGVIVTDERTELIYEDHHLGEFQYLCAGYFVVSERESLPPPALPPAPPMLPPLWTAEPIPECAPVPPTPLPIPLPIYIEPTDPVVYKLDVVFLLDVTGTMPSNLKTMGDAVLNMTTKLALNGLDDVNYFTSYYTTKHYMAYLPETDTIDNMTPSDYVPPTDPPIDPPLPPDGVSPAYAPAVSYTITTGYYDGVVHWVDLNNALGVGPYAMTDPLTVKASMDIIYKLFPGGILSYEDGQAAVVRANTLFGPEFRHAGVSAPTPYVDTIYIVITDESNMEGDASTNEAIAMANANNASIMWIINKTLSPSSTMIETTTQTGGGVMQVMDGTADWGAAAAKQLTSIIVEVVTGNPAIDMEPFDAMEAWLTTVPKTVDLALPELPTPSIAPSPLPPTTGPSVAVFVPEYTGWHTFAIENLACNTWMVDVTINSEDSNLKIGPAVEYSDSALNPIPKPDQTEMHWDEIPPAHEVRFSVYGSSIEGTVWEGLKLSYGLEIR